MNAVLRLYKHLHTCILVTVALPLTLQAHVYYIYIYTVIIYIYNYIISRNLERRAECILHKKDGERWRSVRVFHRYFYLGTVDQ